MQNKLIAPLWGPQVFTTFSKPREGIQKLVEKPRWGKSINWSFGPTLNLETFLWSFGPNSFGPKPQGIQRRRSLTPSQSLKKKKHWNIERWEPKINIYNAEILGELIRQNLKLNENVEKIKSLILKLQIIRGSLEPEFQRNYSNVGPLDQKPRIQRSLEINSVKNWWDLIKIKKISSGVVGIKIIISGRLIKNKKASRTKIYNYYKGSSFGTSNKS